MNEAILNAAEGEWEKSVDVLRGLIDQDAENFVVSFSFGRAKSPWGLIWGAL